MERACPIFAKCISTPLRASYSLGLNTNYIISVIQSNHSDLSTREMSQMHNEIWHGTKALILICSDTRSDEDDLLTLTDKWDERRERDTQGEKKGRKHERKGTIYASRKAAFSRSMGASLVINSVSRVSRAICIFGLWTVGACYIIHTICSIFSLL